MTSRTSSKAPITFDATCELFETALATNFRPDFVADVSDAKNLGRVLARVRQCMRSHLWRAGGQEVRLDKVVRAYESRTRRGGFHVLHDWDGVADGLNADIIPVDVLDYLSRERGGGQPDRTVPAILIDYYFLYLLALLSLAVWDEGDADSNLDRLNDLVQHLQGPHGSGQQFVRSAATLILIATSHFALQEGAYGRCLDKVRTLNDSHRTAVALLHAASLGSHLRFGFEAAYGRDTITMRNDNIVDYPWLSFSLATLMTAYARMHRTGIEGPDRETIVEGILNGLSPDARAFVGDHPPQSLARCEAERSGFRQVFHEHRRLLVEEFQRLRPSDGCYSPLSLFFNFSQNVLKGTVVDALFRRQPGDVALDDLLTGVPGPGPDGAAKELLATTLMGYARANPSPIRGRMIPAIVYDPRSGRQAFTTTIRKITE
jgi:hypothetical protein